mmetsp:Transcript_6661/g.16123  ORF Transcript_6661/g.16123 Transcript_6661/m.16123 type:complete len:200 (+) Transcript_6661:83-682(+)
MFSFSSFVLAFAVSLSASSRSFCFSSSSLTVLICCSSPISRFSSSLASANSRCICALSSCKACSCCLWRLASSSVCLAAISSLVALAIALAIERAASVTPTCCPRATSPSSWICLAAASCSSCCFDASSPCLAASRALLAAIFSLRLCSCDVRSALSPSTTRASLTSSRASSVSLSSAFLDGSNATSIILVRAARMADR